MWGHRERGGLETRTILYIKWTAEGVDQRGRPRVFYDVRHTSVAGDMMVSHEGTIFRETRWHRGC